MGVQVVKKVDKKEKKTFWKTRHDRCPDESSWTVLYPFWDVTLNAESNDRFRRTVDGRRIDRGDFWSYVPQYNRCSNTKPMTTWPASRGTCNARNRLRRTGNDESETNTLAEQTARSSFARDAGKTLFERALAGHYVRVRFIYRGCCDNVAIAVSLPPDRLDRHWRWHRVWWWCTIAHGRSIASVRTHGRARRTCPWTLSDVTQLKPVRRRTATWLCNTRRVWKTEPGAASSPPPVFQKPNYLGQRTFYLRTKSDCLCDRRRWISYTDRRRRGKSRVKTLIIRIFSVAQSKTPNRFPKTVS